MATIVKKNNRSQDAIRKSLGLSSGPGANTVYQQSQTPVRATSGGLAAPKGWYNESPGLSGIKSAVNGLKTNLGSALGGTVSNVRKTVNDYKGISSNSSANSPTTGFQRAAAPVYQNFERDDAPEYQSFVYADWNRPEYQTSDLTKDYLQKMKDAEAAKPEAFQSRYEGAIQNILDGILNKKSFDMNTDPNYQALYNQYAQQYQAQANRGMRDTLGAMQAATGGYGSTAATAAAGQAYDRSMEGLNSNNIALLQLAYQMNQANQADRYNQLGAVTGLDTTDYARYRDTVNDYMNDRNYYAQQYQNMYGNDWQKYAFDTNLDWDKYQFQTNLDWQNHQAEQQREWDDYALGTNIDFQNHQNAQNRAWDDYTFGTNMDWNQYADAQNRAWQEKEFEYQQGRDAKSDYDSAFNRALSLAQSGLGIPAAYGNQLEPETLERLNALAAQVQAQQALAAAGGSGGSRGGGGGNGNGGNKNDSEPIVTNAHGQTWVYVRGVGRIGRGAELTNKIENNEIEEVWRTEKGGQKKLTYRAVK